MRERGEKKIVRSGGNKETGVYGLDAIKRIKEGKIKGGKGEE